jgi:SAM-dependent methyltransferase
MTENPRRLPERHQAEAAFHDQKYAHGESYPRHYMLNPTYPIYQRMLALAGEQRNKCVLEYGCGEGWIARDLALAGARVYAFDISPVAVRHTCEVLVAAGLRDRCEVRRMGAEKLDYPDACFDTAIGLAILHHLDIELALAELYRVLKPGGIAFFAEPLGTNPLINLYRRFTPQYRTADETPLNLASMAPMLSRFSTVLHTDYYLTALAAVALAYVPSGKRLYPGANRLLMRFDDALLRLFPRLGRLAWYTILQLQK